MAPTICPKCNTPNRAGARFCVKCRQPLATTPVQPTAPPRPAFTPGTPLQPLPPPAPVAAQSAGQSRRLSPGICAVLGFGCLGVLIVWGVLGYVLWSQFASVQTPTATALASPVPSLVGSPVLTPPAGAGVTPSLPAPATPAVTPSPSAPTALPATSAPTPSVTAPVSPSVAATSALPIVPAASSTPTARSSGALPAGRWRVRTYKTDDAAAVFVNGQMVAVSTRDRDSDWVNINDYMLGGRDNIVAFASYNGWNPASWGFGIRRDDVSVWGVEQTGNSEWALNYAQQVVIHPDGKVEPLPIDTSTRKPPGKIYVRSQKAQDISAILVNGQPVDVFWNADHPWVDITSLLYSDRNNTITMAAWNFDGPYAWEFMVRQDETIVWGKQGSGSGRVNRVFQENITITPGGQVIESLPVKLAKDNVWAVASYKADDTSAIFVNGQMAGVSTRDRDLDWVAINKFMAPDRDNIIAFASYNGWNPAGWGFGVRRDDVLVWGVEQSGNSEWALNYAQQVVIRPNGNVEPLAFDTTAHKSPPGKWYVRGQKTQDISAILVNGQPVDVFWNADHPWVDITGLLYADRNNTITFAAWNIDGPYAWDFAVKHDENIVWAVSNTGSGRTGIVFQQNVTVTGSGEVRQ